MRVKGLNHVAIAVENLEDAVNTFRQVLGMDPKEIKEVKDQKVRVAMFDVNGIYVELIEPTSEDSPVYKFVKEKGGGLHHIAFSVDSIKDAIEELESKGFVWINKEPRIGAEGKPIAFLHPKSTKRVLIEFVEEGGE
ncbi:MAG: methylmalonyl-CoA epimerase [Thermoplasmata archaeon]|nr:methylmalonyl-CoA epimerase [Euryarchaeota archaeon]RLF66988.1 MAG: methylmalonyl-CoA epimerase [Thermoplasmata archaeon]